MLSPQVSRLRFWRFGEGVAETRVVHKGLVGQCLQEGQQVGALLVGQGEAAYKAALERAVPSITDISPAEDVATTCFRFDDDRGGGCALRPRCYTGKGGRRLTTSPGYAALVAARARQPTEAFKVAYRTYRGGVEGCLSALVRGHGLRVNRYIGRAKNHLRALFVGAGVNLRRAARWLAGVCPMPRQNRLAQALTGA